MDERAELIAQLEEIINKHGGEKVLRVALNSLGSIPIVGGMFAAASALHGECEQHEFNQKIIDWASLTNADLQRVLEALEKLQAEPNRKSFFLLIEEIFGDSIASQIFSQSQFSVHIILNPATRTDLEPYIKKGWVSISPTGSICSMGAENRVGNHIEELKRPYGLGSGFILTFMNKAVEDKL